MWKTDEREAESITLLTFVLQGALIVGEWGKWSRIESYLGPAEIESLFFASAKIPKCKGRILPFSLYGSGIDQGNEEWRWAQDFILLPQGFESFPSDLSRARWHNLVYVEYL